MLTPDQIAEYDLKTQARGYSKSQVDALLDEVIDTIEAKTARIAQLEAELSAAREAPGAAPPPRSAEPSVDEDTLSRVLVTAQRTADEMVARARAEADQVVGQAEDEARRVREQAEARLAMEEESLAALRDRIAGEVASIRASAREHSHRMRGALSSQLRQLDELDRTLSDTEPEVTEGGEDSQHAAEFG